MREFIKIILLPLGLWVLPAQTAHADAVIPESLNKLISQCGACHGMDGNSVINTFPSIAGISENYFTYVIQEYTNGNRKSDVMKNLAAELSVEDIDQLAKYYAKQTYKSRDQAVDENLAQKGQVIHETYCAKCHENNGFPDQYSYGILAGQWMPYLRQAINDYLDGTRKTNPMMLIKLNRVKNEIGDQGFEQLAHFYAGVKSQPSQSPPH